MSLIDFASEETKKNILNKKSEILKSKHNLVENLINEINPRHEVEKQVYPPEKLEKIKFLQSNTSFGKREKVCFFITPEELIKLKNKFKVIEQFQEFRIASSDIDKFMGGVLNG